MHSAKFLIFFLFIFTVSCSFLFFKSKARDYEDIANEISFSVAKKLKKKHHMDWIGEGGGMMGSVYMIGLSFQINHLMDQKEARVRIVDCVEELLTAFNENKEIRPFLKTFPFTTKNIQIAIYINYPNGKEVFDPHLSIVSVYESDHIEYCTVDRSNRHKYKNRIREPYQEALATVKNSKNYQLDSKHKGFDERFLFDDNK